MTCSNDPRTVTITLASGGTNELTCTPNGNAKIVFFSNTLDDVDITFKSNDSTPRISGVRAVISESFELTPHPQAFLNGRKANLTVPYDASGVSDPTKVKTYYYTIVDPVGWYPLPTGDHVYDSGDNRLLYVKIPSITAQGKYVVVEEN